MNEEIILKYDPKQDNKLNKLARNGVKVTDALFQRIYNECSQAYKDCGSYEEFLARTPEYTVENPLITTGYNAYMQTLVDNAIGGIAFSRLAQKKLVQATITNTTGELVRSNGEDLKNHIRQVSLHAYDNKIPPQEYWKLLKAPPLIKGINGAKQNLSSEARCKMIARTETKRSQTVSNYIIAKDRGATHWYAVGNEDDKRCQECEDTYGTRSDPEYYDLEDTSNLPPLHPNCRDSAVFVRR